MPDSSTLASPNPAARTRRAHWLRKTLRLSQQEAVASSTMTATSDNFFNAFAIHLNASAVQMGWLTALPQFFGALFQLVSVWIGAHWARKTMVVSTAAVQALVVALIALLAALADSDAVGWLILLAVGYHATLNLIQPHWRAWMGSIVPQRRRGVFFANRTRITMVASLIVFIGGGGLLAFSDRLDMAWLGFTLLFGVAAAARLVSSLLLKRMHDPDPRHLVPGAQAFSHTLRQIREAMQDPTFRHYSIFVAGMQAMVAISAPFFAVYMLNDLEFSYLDYSINNAASIATQFVMLKFWGRFSDRFGNRLVMLITSCMIPLLPLLWIVSSSQLYLIFVQVISGIAWSGFTLSTANYLYDIRPHRTNFALYAAAQSGLSATLICVGAISGGYLAAFAPELLQALGEFGDWRSPLYLVFATSALLRLAMTLWFIPRAVEPRVRNRPQLLKIIFRVSRINSISGVALDWLTVTRKHLAGDDETKQPPR